MPDNKGIITEDDTVYDVLIKFPQLKQVLINISPKYKNLQNPVIFNTVAKITPLKKAAKAGGIYVNELLLQLNDAIGKGKEYFDLKKKEIPKLQQDFLKRNFGEKADNGQKEKPAWLDKSADFKTIDARKMDEPFGVVIQEASETNSGEGFILVQKFEPAPLIGHLERQGFEVFVDKKRDEEFHVFFYKQ